MDVGEMAMNIFTPEYVAITVILLAVVYHLVKTSDTNEESDESSRNNDKSKRYH